MHRFADRCCGCVCGQFQGRRTQYSSFYWNMSEVLDEIDHLFSHV